MDMNLNTRRRFRQKASKEDYDLSCPYDEAWSSKKERILIVLETVDSQDLKEGRLLHDRSAVVLSNLMTYTMGRAKTFGFRRGDVAFATVNFNCYKFFDLPMDTWPAHRRRSSARVGRIIEELKPTMVIVFGDDAAKTMCPGIEFIEKKRGWVHTYKHGDYTCKLVNTLDLHPLYSPKTQDLGNDEESEEFGDIYGAANLLGYVSRNVMSALTGHLPWSLADLEVKTRKVDTWEKFQKFWKKLISEPIIAVDTETENGTVHYNAIKMIQFAFSQDEGYILPLEIVDTPFSEEEIRKIKKRLRKFFAAKRGEYAVKYLIMQYGIYDLRILRVCLGIPLIHHPVWEIQAGLWCLNENTKYLASSPFNTPQYGLEQILMSYGNDFYKTAVFGKGDRANPHLTVWANQDFRKYGAMDVQSIWGIHVKQIEEASTYDIDGRPWVEQYKNIVLDTFSNTIHALSTMKQRGSTVDKEYLTLLAGNKSPLKKLIKEANAELLEMPKVKKANKQLLNNSSGQTSSKGLFGRTMVIFNFGKKEHLTKLFLEVMALEPVAFSKKTKLPKIDKVFVAKYKEKHKEVAKYGELNKLKKLYSTYVKGWLRTMKTSPDSRHDYCLRPDYAFAPVVTGRLNSSRPSLQNVPAHGDVAKYIKRMFIAPLGKLLVKFDYSAHEIRNWSYVSGDKKLADAFRQGQQLRQKYRMAKTAEEKAAVMKELKTRGDLHIWNAKLFFDKWIEKSDPLRDAVKRLIFGLIYGLGMSSLGRSIFKSIPSVAKMVKHLEELEKKAKEFKDAQKPVPQKLEDEIEDLKETINSYENSDEATAHATSLADKLYATFVKGGKWLKWSMNHALDTLYTYNPIGQRRNLFGIMTGIKSLVSAMMRRAANSPIQGLASQEGVNAARLIATETWETLTELGLLTEKSTEMPYDITKAVHDALHMEVPYAYLLISIHVTQWAATYGVAKHYKDVYDFEFTIEPEIEMEFGAHEAAMFKWDWSDDQLWDILYMSLEEQAKLGNCPDVDEAFEAILLPYRDKQIRGYLNEKYPILNCPYVKAAPFRGGWIPPSKRPKEEKK